jgi:short-subunit dehydrogenase
MQIAESIACVTGASEGIGAAIAQELRARGARVALVARREAELHEIAGPDGLAIPADLTDSAQRARIIPAVIERFGRIDLLINNAGLGISAPSWRADLPDVRYMYELNFFAALELGQHAVADMRRRRRGMIVNIGSVAGKVSMPWFSLYSSTKFALDALTSGMRMELARDGIHTMIVCPGFVRTEFHRHVLGGPPPGALKRGRPAEVTAQQVARAVASGIERDTREIVIPNAARLLIAAHRLFPALVDRILTSKNAEYGES